MYNNWIMLKDTLALDVYLLMSLFVLTCETF